MTDVKITETLTDKEIEAMLEEIVNTDKSEERHINKFSLRGEKISVTCICSPYTKQQKWGGAILGAGIGGLIFGRIIKGFLGNEGAIIGTIMGTLVGGALASHFINSPCMEKDTIKEEKSHPVISPQEAVEELNSGKGFHITERHKIEAENRAIYDITHWVKIDNLEDLISFYNIEMGKPPRNEFERIGQLLDKFDYKVLVPDGSIFYHAESAPFTDAKKILTGQGVNIRKYKQFRKEIINRDPEGNITGYTYENTGEDIISDKVTNEAELEYLIKNH